MSYSCVGRFTLAAANLILIFNFVGCASDFTRSNATNPRKPLATGKKSDGPRHRFVGDLARPWGTKQLQVEGVSLAVHLAGTGSDPGPTAERSMMMDEMKRRDIAKPDSLLASNQTALCMVRAVLPPGAQEGDRVDIDVRVPAKSKTSSLENGWLMQTRLKEFAKLNNRLASGHELAICEGEIVIDSIMEGSDDPVLKTRGRILGGGVVTESRELGLRLRKDHLSAKTSALIGTAINQRFHIYAHGQKKGVANPKNDSFIELVVHPRYKDNLPRYIRVIEAIAVKENSTALVQRLENLQSRLLSATSAAQAAVQLEAIGSDAIPVLREGLRSTDPEVQFYAAEALAYLDQADAAVTLTEAIRREPAFRSRAFLALAAMNDMTAIEELAVLLHDSSVETRYAAFRAISQNAPEDPLVLGDKLSGKFFLHKIDSSASPLVHISKNDRSEIVLFGRSFPLASPIVLVAGSRMIVRDTLDGRVKIKRLSDIEGGDRQLIVDADLESVIRGVTELGGKYTDVVNIISQAKQNGCLNCKVAYSALPKDGRSYDRSKASSFQTQDTPPTGTAELDGESRPNFAPVIESAAAYDQSMSGGVQGGGLHQGSSVKFEDDLALSATPSADNRPTGIISIVDDGELQDAALFLD